MFNIQLDIDPKSIKMLNKIDDDVKTGLLKGVRKAMFFVEGESKKRFGSAGNLRVRSGRLRSSIKSSVQKQGKDIVGIVGSNVIYASVHEFGNDRVPARPFITPVFDEKLNIIEGLIMDSIMEEVK